jgi:hypothetical protein
MPVLATLAHPPGGPTARGAPLAAASAACAASMAARAAARSASSRWMSSSDFCPAHAPRRPHLSQILLGRIRRLTRGACDVRNPETWSQAPGFAAGRAFAHGAGFVSTVGRLSSVGGGCCSCGWGLGGAMRLGGGPACGSCWPGGRKGNSGWAVIASEWAGFGGLRCLCLTCTQKPMSHRPSLISCTLLSKQGGNCSHANHDAPSAFAHMLMSCTAANRAMDDDVQRTFSKGPAGASGGWEVSAAGCDGVGWASERKGMGGGGTERGGSCTPWDQVSRREMPSSASASFAALPRKDGA